MEMHERAAKYMKGYSSQVRLHPVVFECGRGVTLTEFAGIFQSLGCTEAYNIDGGGSSTMVVNGVVKNVVSDGSERAVCNGVVMVNVKPKVVSTVFSAGQTVTVSSAANIRLGPGGTLRGRVVDEAGAGLAGARFERDHQHAGGSDQDRSGHERRDLVAEEDQAEQRHLHRLGLDEGVGHHEGTLAHHRQHSGGGGDLHQRAGTGLSGISRPPRNCPSAVMTSVAPASSTFFAQIRSVQGTRASGIHLSRA